MAPQLSHAGSRFLARGTPVPREAAAGDHLQAEYHLWLVGHQLDHGRAPWRDPYTFRPESPPRWNFGGWPFGLVFWPLDALFGHVRAWNLFLLLTYLAAGLPIVASDVNANRLYLKDGENGYLVGTLAQWEERLTKLIEDPALRREPGARARSSVERDFSIDSAVPKYLSLFERLLALPRK